MWTWARQALALGVVAAAPAIAFAQSSTPPDRVHVGADVGLTIDHAGASRFYVPPLDGRALVAGVTGGARVAKHYWFDAELSVARSFSQAQRLPRLGGPNDIDSADTTVTHRDTVASFLVLRRVGVLWVGGGMTLARGDTRWDGVETVLTLHDGYLTRPYAQRLTSLDAGLVAAVDVRAPVGRHAAIALMFRMSTFGVAPEGVPPHFTIRSMAGLDFGF